MPRATAAAKPQPQSQAVAAKPAKFVTVACKIPMGIVLQLCVKETYLEEGLNGTRERTRFSKTGQTFIIRGPSSPSGPVPRGYVRPTVVGGYALTNNIPQDFWEQWLEQNAANPIVVNQMILAEDKRAGTISAAKERKDVKSGLEPMDPDGDYRMPKPIVGDAVISQIKTADEMAGRQGLPEAEDEDGDED